MFLGLSEYAFWGAIEMGMIYSLVALGVFMSFRVLDFPDLTVDGSFPLGGVVCAVMIVQGWNPWVAMTCAFFAGAIAGFVTAFISVQFKILNLLASILTMTALMSVNIRVTGLRSNQGLLGQPTIFSPFEESQIADYLMRPALVAVIVLGAFIILSIFLASETGLAMRATGANARMAKANGVKTGFQVMFGVAFSNAFVGLAGALYAQVSGNADVTQGVGTIVVGLAAVILGETILPSRHIRYALMACIVGSVLYRIALAIAIEYKPFGMVASDLNLISASLVLLALLLPYHWRKIFA